MRPRRASASNRADARQQWASALDSARSRGCKVAPPTRIAQPNPAGTGPPDHADRHQPRLAADPSGRQFVGFRSARFDRLARPARTLEARISRRDAVEWRQRAVGLVRGGPSDEQYRPRPTQQIWPGSGRR
jgi:hypothetical protein